MRVQIGSRSARAATVLATSLLISLDGSAASAAPGQLDTGFGGDGKVTTNFTGGHDPAFSLAIQADGKVVAAGTANYRGTNARFALARYETNGVLDPTFGGDGKVTTNFSRAWDGAYSVAIQPADGKIVVAGEAGGTGPAESRAARFALARYDTSGMLDPSFGGDGKVTTNISPGAEFVFGAAIQAADGKIVVTGRAGGRGGRIALARYNPNGSLDATFAGDGKVTTNRSLGLASRITSVAPRPFASRSIVAAPAASSRRGRRAARLGRGGGASASHRRAGPSASAASTFPAFPFSSSGDGCDHAKSVST
jgi:uncharacterized delta-60 repeat protein